MRKWARRVLYTLGGLVAAGAMLFALGLRVVFDGGGGMHLAFTKSQEQQASEIEQHRETQRAQAPAPAVMQPAPAVDVATASPTKEKPSIEVLKPSARDPDLA